MNTKNLKKRNFSINLPEELVVELDEIREAESRSRSNIIEYLVRLGLKKIRKDN